MVVCIDLIEKMTFRQKPEGTKRTSRENSWGKAFQINKQYKGYKMRACLMSSRNTKEASIPGVGRARRRAVGNEVTDVTVVSSCGAFVGHWVEIPDLYFNRVSSAAGLSIDHMIMS